MAAFEGGFAALDPEAADLGADVEDVAVDGNEGGVLADLDGPEAIGDAEHAGGDEGQPLPGGLAWKAEGNGLGGGVRDIADVGGTEAVGALGEGDGDSGGMQTGRYGELGVVRVRVVDGLGEDVFVGDGDPVGSEELG